MRLISALVLLCVVAGCSSSPPRQPDWSATPDWDTASRAQRDVVRQALGYVGVPYRYGGDSAETGFDCSGLVWRVYRQAAGIRLPRDSYGLSRKGVAVASSSLRPGDLVFFNTQRRPYSHVGIYLGNNRFVHAPSSGGYVSIAVISDRYWRNRFDGGRRVVF